MLTPTDRMLLVVFICSQKVNILGSRAVCSLIDLSAALHCNHKRQRQERNPVYPRVIQAQQLRLKFM